MIKIIVCGGSNVMCKFDSLVPGGWQKVMFTSQQHEFNHLALN